MSFYADNGETLPVHFQQSADENGYTISYSTLAPDLFTREFIIDPVPEYVWGKYIGDSLNTEVRGVITDRFGDVCICGMTQSIYTIATAGAYQDTITDSIGDAFLSKYTNTGAMIWSTYFGGPELDVANDVYIDTSFNIVITGTTYSPIGITDSLGHQDTLGGDADAFVARFNESGQLAWATYFGSDSLDVGMKLSTDFDFNIYLSGLTKSDTAIATDSAFQQNLMGKLMDLLPNLIHLESCNGQVIMAEACTMRPQELLLGILPCISPV